MVWICWEVWRAGRLLTEVYWEIGMTAAEVRRALVEHDGYPADIWVKARS